MSLTLTGNEFANILTGNDGDNTLNGGLGADTMTGGAGSDFYVVDDAGDRAIELAGLGTDLVYATVSYSLGGSHLENLSLAGTDNLTGLGNSLANVITGNGGANVLNGLVGADTMSGGAGSDTYYVDNAADRAIEADSAVGTDLVFASVSYSLAGSHLENLTLTGAGNLNGAGNSLANVITGNSGANVLNGGLGADTMSGGAGSDTYYVDNVGDRALEANGAAGTDLVYASASYSLAGSDLENLTLTGTGNLAGTGNSIANTLTGNGGANVLDGQGGNDLLTGGATVQLARSVFTALGAGPLSEAAFRDLSAGSADASDRILYDKATGALSYDADGSGLASAAVQFAILDTKATVTHLDFMIV
ncbi:calcium-binding protein [Methylobacterium sp. Leaf399]|uniref:calcium-binding protein n=1 Tax=Methylobacterium sp. Leaf399 TaxID=1736364 RepID=UPI0012E3C501